MISLNKCHFLPLFHTTFGLAVMGKLALKIACTKLQYGIGFTIRCFKINKCQFCYPFLGLLPEVLPHLNLVALVIPYLGTLRCNVTPFLALRLLRKTKLLSPLLPLFTNFGSAVMGNGIHKIASIGRSVLENTKVRYDNGCIVHFVLMEPQ